jgi:DNA-directed RNA polymerase subunit RPC12/RpoP
MIICPCCNSDLITKIDTQYKCEECGKTFKGYEDIEHLSKEQIIENLTTFVCNDFDNIEYFFNEHLGCVPSDESPCTIPILHKVLRFMGANNVKKFLVDYLTDNYTHQDLIDIAEDYYEYEEDYYPYCDDKFK